MPFWVQLMQTLVGPDEMQGMTGLNDILLSTRRRSEAIHR